MEKWIARLRWGLVWIVGLGGIVCLLSCPRVRAGQPAANLVAGNDTPAAKTSKQDTAGRKLAKNPQFWPPLKHQFYPDMELVNQDGNHTRLSDMRGKIIIVQFAAMQCGLSQAYSGANRPGYHPYGICFPPTNFRYFPDMMSDFAGVSFKRPGVVWVQILLYDEAGNLATPEDVKKWADHFELKTSDNIYVLAPTKEMDCKKSRMMVPGFQLINRAFVLVSDSTGALPKDDLFNRFFPELQRQFF